MSVFKGSLTIEYCFSLSTKVLQNMWSVPTAVRPRALTAVFLDNEQYKLIVVWKSFVGRDFAVERQVRE